MHAYWHCVNRACGLTALSTREDRDLETRWCVCGSEMRRREHSAVFAYLNFLREETNSQTGEPNEKEHGR